MSLVGFPQPAFQDILNRVVADFNSRIPGADANLRRSALNCFSQALSAGMYELYSAVDFTSDQVSADTAAGPNLDSWGRVWGVTRKQASIAAGLASWTGQAGVTVPAGTLVQFSDGTQYSVTTPTLISGTGTANLPIAALVAASAGNRASGDVLTLVNGVAGVNASGSVLCVGGGGDLELDGSPGTMQGYRGRIKQRIQNPPQGGAAADYIAWTLAYADVTRVWVYPGELGVGTVTVRFCMDNAYANGIPLSPDIATVQSIIDAVRPVTAAVTVVAPIQQLVNITITGLSASNLATAQAQIQAELLDQFQTDGFPGCTLRFSRISAAISRAVGESYFEVLSPSADVVCSTGYLPVLGSITYS
jgi:uncharacterized phage protein gp47/JayE